jgi:hypothetical protein
LKHHSTELLAEFDAGIDLLGGVERLGEEEKKKERDAPATVWGETPKPHGDGGKWKVHEMIRIWR